MGYSKLIMFDGNCLIVAEVAQAHDGSLGLAHSYIDAAARAGAGAVKFQTHIAAAESTPDEPWRVKFSTQDRSRFDYWKRMEFEPSQWRELAEHAKELGLVFVCSPFSTEAVDVLLTADVDVFKIASGEVGNLPLLKSVSSAGKPVILSSGMSPWSELDEAVKVFVESGLPLAVLQCTSEYPCPPELVGLNVIDEIGDRYGLPTGLSDHSGTIYAGLAAATKGVAVLEVHVTFSREMFGPDVPASITFDELANLTQGVRFIEEMLSHPVDKVAMASSLNELRRTFMKSIVASQNLAKGTVLDHEHLTVKKPGTGLPASDLESMIGRRLVKPISVDQQLQPSDVEEFENP